MRTCKVEDQEFNTKKTPIILNFKKLNQEDHSINAICSFWIVRFPGKTEDEPIEDRVVLHTGKFILMLFVFIFRVNNSLTKDLKCL